MEAFLEKFHKTYSISFAEIEFLTSKMQSISFAKGDYIVTEGNRSDRLFIIKTGTVRGFRMRDGIDSSLWFSADASMIFLPWGYTRNLPSEISIEAETDVEAFAIAGNELNDLCRSSLEMANIVRIIFEEHARIVETELLLFADHANAEERYLAMMKREPHLMQNISLKKMASYLSITPQSLSRIRANLKNR